MHRIRLLIRFGIPLCILPVLSFAQKYNIYTTTLPNGLEVIAVENHIVPLVTVEIDVHNGSFTEPPDYNGLSHLYEHMFFKANASIPSQEKYLERMRQLGMNWNGSTSEERVNYFFTLSKDSLLQGMQFMKAAITTPLFLQSELEHERPVVTGEYDRAEANPMYHLYVAVSKKLWFEHYSRKNPLGERSVILTADQQKMQTIKKRYYVPNNSALIVTGDVDHREVFALAGAQFKDWPRGEDPFALYPVPEHPPLPHSDTVIVEQPVNAVSVMISREGPSVMKDPAATYAADVLSYILAQRASTFQKHLVESGLCTYASLTYSTLNHTGPITVSAQMSGKRYREGIAQLFKEVDALASADYYTDSQLENAKTQLERGETYDQESPSTYAHTIGYWWSVTGSLDYYLHYVENLRRVTRADINAYIQKYIAGKPYVMGILVSPGDRKTILP